MLVYWSVNFIESTKQIHPALPLTFRGVYVSTNHERHFHQVAADAGLPINILPDRSSEPWIVGSKKRFFLDREDLVKCVKTRLHVLEIG